MFKIKTCISVNLNEGAGRLQTQNRPIRPALVVITELLNEQKQADITQYMHPKPECSQAGDE